MSLSACFAAAIARLTLGARVAGGCACAGARGFAATGCSGAGARVLRDASYSALRSSSFATLVDDLGRALDRHGDGMVVEERFGVERGHAAGARRGDGLAVDVIGDGA